MQTKKVRQWDGVNLGGWKREELSELKYVDHARKFGNLKDK